MAKRSRVSRERRAFEARTLAELKEAGATAAELRRCRWLLSQGRVREGDGHVEALNLRAAERVGIAAFRRVLAGDPPPPIIFNIHPGPPPVSHHG